MAEPQQAAAINGDDVDMSSSEHSEGEADLVGQLKKQPPSAAAAEPLDAAALQRLNQVKARLKALKKMQFEFVKLEARFYEEVRQLELKYHQLYVPLYEKRSKIISGQVEPSGDECDWASDEDEELQEYMTKLKLDDNKKPNESGEKVNDANASIKGIPEFWLTIFRRVVLIAEMIHDHDLPLLKHLEDITLVANDALCFTLNFHFSPNEYFTNNVLQKVYYMRCAPQENEPFEFDGPEIYRCEGCKIDWKAGMNLTMKTIRKKQKNKSQGTVRFVTSEVPTDSFFNFFSPPVVPEGQDIRGLEEESRDLLICDFEIGHYISERIVPRAVLYFTGEAVSDDEEDDDDEENEDDEELDSDGGESDGGNNSDAGREKNCKQQ